MAAKKRGKDAFEYVLVKDHSTIVDDLRMSGQDLQNSISEALETAQLYEQKHDLVMQAIDSTDQIAADIRNLLKVMPLKEPRRGPATYRPVIVRPRPVKPSEEKELVKRSQRALESLNKNIAELKSELRKE